MQHTACRSRQRHIACASRIITVSTTVVIDFQIRNILGNGLCDLLTVIFRHIDHHIVVRVELKLFVVHEYGILWIEDTRAISHGIPSLEQEMSVLRQNLCKVDQSALDDKESHIFAIHDILQPHIQAIRCRLVGVSLNTLHVVIDDF